MQQKSLVLAGAGVVIFVLGSITHAADPASNKPAATPQQIYLIRDNPFFNNHIEKAVQHAREAEIAGNMGESEVLLEHAKISLMQAREAQRAGTVPGLNEGIANLKKAVSLSTWLPPASTPQTRSGELPQASMQAPSAEPPQASTQASSVEPPQASTQAPSAEVPQGSAQISAGQATGEKSLTATQRTDAAVRSATDAVREARKNLSEAGGLKYKELQPQAVKTVAQ